MHLQILIFFLNIDQLTKSTEPRHTEERYAPRCVLISISMRRAGGVPPLVVMFSFPFRRDEECPLVVALLPFRCGEEGCLPVVQFSPPPPLTTASVNLTQPNCTTLNDSALLHRHCSPPPPPLSSTATTIATALLYLRVVQTHYLYPLKPLSTLGCGYGFPWVWVWVSAGVGIGFRGYGYG